MKKKTLKWIKRLWNLLLEVLQFTALVACILFILYMVQLIGI